MLSTAAFNALLKTLEELVRLGSPDWAVLFRLFGEKKAHPLAFLQSRAFMQMFTKICAEEYPYTAFADAFHTVRSMLLPVLHLPRHRRRQHPGRGGDGRGLQQRRGRYPRPAGRDGLHPQRVPV